MQGSSRLSLHDEDGDGEGAQQGQLAAVSGNNLQPEYFLIRRLLSATYHHRKWIMSLCALANKEPCLQVIERRESVMMQEDSFTLEQPASSRRAGSEFLQEANRLLSSPSTVSTIIVLY